MTPDPLNLIITGVGGQGNVLLSQTLGRALVDKGFRVSVGETFGLSQRGGSVQSHLRISRNNEYGGLIPAGQAHVILGLEPLETLRILPVYGQPEVDLVVNSRPIPPLNVIAGEARYPSTREIRTALEELSRKVWWVGGTSAAKKLGDTIMTNIVLLGALTATGLLPLDESAMETALGDTLPLNRLKKNMTAFRRGARLIREMN